jgi:hypothetical protein
LSYDGCGRGRPAAEEGGRSGDRDDDDRPSHFSCTHEEPPTVPDSTYEILRSALFPHQSRFNPTSSAEFRIVTHRDTAQA